MTNISNTSALNTNEVSNDHPEIAKPVVVAKTTNKIERKDLTQEKLKEVLELKDGFFYYVSDTRTHLAGDFAGTVRAHDLYYSLTLFGVMYSGKMLASFYETGEWVNATKGPRLDADGNPVAKAPKKEKTERVPRTAPVFTPEDIEKAKAAAAAKREANKKKMEETKSMVNTVEPETDVVDETTQPTAEASAEATPDF